MQISDGRFFNPICTVNFGGFKSDTYALQRNGWQISANQSQIAFGGGMSLALKHEGYRLYAMTSTVGMSQIMSLTNKGFNSADWTELVFNVQYMASEMEIRVSQPAAAMVGFAAIDAAPCYQESYKIGGLEDFIPFRPISSEAPELIVDPSKINEIMDMILKAQDHKQAEIRENKRRAAWKDQSFDSKGYNPANDIRASVISIAR